MSEVKLSVRDSSLTPALREKSLCGRRAHEPKGNWDLFCKLFQDSDSEVGFQRFLWLKLFPILILDFYLTGKEHISQTLMSVGGLTYKMI